MNNHHTYIALLLIACASFYPPLFSMSGFHEKIRTLLQQVKNGERGKKALNKGIPYRLWHPIPLLVMARQDDDESFDLMKQLLIAGANPNIKKMSSDREIYYETALSNAVVDGTSKGLALLLRHGASASQNFFLLYYVADHVWSRSCSEFLFAAREAELVAKAHLLLAHGADPNSKHWYSPLVRVVKNANVFKNDTHNSRSKLQCAQDTNRALLKLFLYYNANPYLKEEKYSEEAEKKSPIEYAQEAGDVELVHLLESGYKTTQLTSLLREVTTPRGAQLPHEVARKIAEYCYPESEVAHVPDQVALLGTTNE